MLYKEENFKVSNWAGGKTTEIGIFPEDSKYLDRNFIWRLSSATVDTDESVFSKLPDYDRVLLVLKGDVVLAHDGQRVARLKELEQDRFDGAYNTKSFGKITDYNLIVGKGNQGFLDVINATNVSESVDTSDYPNYDFFTQGFFCKDGFATVSFGNNILMLKPGEQLIVNFAKTEKVNISIMGDGVLVHSQIFYNYNPQEYGPEIVPKEKPTMQDFSDCIYLANIQFRGAKIIFKNLRNQWFDEELKKVIRKIERPCLPFFLCLIGIMIIAVNGIKEQEATLTWILIIFSWIIIDCLIITPLIYFIATPKPVRAHIKDINNLTPYEQDVYETEQNTNERLERILKKYKNTGRNQYIDDDK